MTKKLPPPCDTCPCAGWGLECEGIRAKPEAAAAVTDTRTIKAERAVNLLAGSHRRAEEAEASVRASRYVADFWRSALSGQGNAAAAHALAMVGAALNGVRDPGELGLAADEHAAFQAAVAEEPTP